jgi:hypothetical protein
MFVCEMVFYTGFACLISAALSLLWVHLFIVMVESILTGAPVLQHFYDG